MKSWAERAMRGGGGPEKKNQARPLAPSSHALPNSGGGGRTQTLHAGSSRLERRGQVQCQNDGIAGYGVPRGGWAALGRLAAARVCRSDIGSDGLSVFLVPGPRKPNTRSTIGHL